MAAMACGVRLANGVPGVITMPDSGGRVAGIGSFRRPEPNLELFPLRSWRTFNIEKLHRTKEVNVAGFVIIPNGPGRTVAEVDAALEKCNNERRENWKQRN